MNFYVGVQLQALKLRGCIFDCLVYGLGDSQPSSWSPSSSSSSVKSENLVYQSRGSHNNDAKSPSQQQSDSVEYYYYYDDDDESAAAANSQNDKQQQQQREPKATKTDDNISSVLDNTSNNSNNNNNNSGSNSNPVNGTVYEDSYYYDNDYDEEEDLQSQEENGNDEQNTQQEQQLASKENVEESPIEESVPIAEIPINQTHSEERETQQPEEKQEHTTTSSITNNTTTTTVTTTTTTTSTTTATPTTTTTTISSSSISPETISKEKVDTDSPSEGSILIGEAIVSVVTTKSVVNGTFSVPETTTNPPPTSTMLQESTESSTSFISSTTEPTSTSTSTTEFSPPSTILASVQTGRSVSGARFLPFASVDKVEQLDSTESIIDKLDRVQSELSSGFLANNRFIPRRYNKKPFSATSLTLPPTTTVAPTSSPISPISITSITKRPKVQTTLDDVAAFLPKDFPKSSYRTSTSAPLTKRPKFQTTLDDVDAFLPKDFPRASYKTSTTTSTTTASSSTKRPKIQTTLDDLDGFLPKDFPKSGFRGGYKRPSYKTSTTTSTSTTTTTTTTAKVASTTEKNAASTRPKALTTIDDIGAFLPPGYKLKKEDATTEKSVLLSEILAKTKGISSKDSASVSTTTEKTKSLQDLFAKSEVDISALLPPGYKPEASSPAPSAAKPSGDPLEELLTKSSVDISALLPSGYKPDAAKSTKSIKSEPAVQDLFAKSNVDISALLPPGFASSDNKNDETVSQQSDNAGASIKNNNNNAGGGSNSFKVVFPSRPGGRKPIHKITTPPTRGAGAVETAAPKIQKGWPIRATTEFTGWPTSSTTPISIEKLLEAARTATVSSANVSLIPTTNEISSTSSTTTTTTTTMRPTTPGICDEDCEVAGTIKIVENATWVPELLDRNTREWQDLAEEIEREMNLVFAKSPVLRKWFRNIRIDAFSQGSVLVDYFIELSDLKEKINTQQLKVIFHDSLRTFNFDNPMEARPKGPVKLGKFTIDPKGTDFVVIPRVAAPKMSEDENRLIPQWAIAVIVIGVGGLLFIIVFGVSVLVNRQHGSKLKPSITAMYEEEVSKNVMSHAPPPSRPASEYQKNDSQTMWNDPGWHDKPFESTSHKILVDGLPYERKYNPYDSWKSEWNGYYYPPTQASGSNSNFSRHHPDYDLNF